MDKRAGIKQRDMLVKYSHCSPAEILSFKDTWMAEIEAPNRLQSDELIAGAPSFLVNAADHFELHLVTGRQHHDRLIEQMQQLRIADYFTGIHNTAQRLLKADIVRRNTAKDAKDVFIGDSGEDVLAGKTLGIFTVGVTSGASSTEQLERYTPDLIVNSVADLVPHTLGGY
jgi:phosphoglycolate phosphatase